MCLFIFHYLSLYFAPKKKKSKIIKMFLLDILQLSLTGNSPRFFVVCFVVVVVVVCLFGFFSSQIHLQNISQKRREHAADPILTRLIGFRFNLIIVMTPAVK